MYWNPIGRRKIGQPKGQHKDNEKEDDQNERGYNRWNKI
jgi:hypothetical protein